ncbi:MAG: hypothetical protein NTZ64_15135 [Polaromonas sp.]|nr:hypothetical protein [Polaromonas sp.]
MATKTIPTQETAPTAQRVTALTPIEYDQESIAVGDVFEVRQKDLQQLLDVSAVELVQAEEA